VPAIPEASRTPTRQSELDEHGTQWRPMVKIVAVAGRFWMRDSWSGNWIP
jgi:hypothetical protein